MSVTTDAMLDEIALLHARRFAAIEVIAATRAAISEVGITREQMVTALRDITRALTGLDTTPGETVEMTGVLQ